MVQDEIEMKETVCKSLVDFLEVEASKVSFQVSTTGMPLWMRHWWRREVFTADSNTTSAENPH
jgi:hypothetical protein